MYFDNPNPEGRPAKSSAAWPWSFSSAAGNAVVWPAKPPKQGETSSNKPKQGENSIQGGNGRKSVCGRVTIGFGHAHRNQERATNGMVSIFIRWPEDGFCTSGRLFDARLPCQKSP